METSQDQTRLVRRLIEALGRDAVLDQREQLLTYEADAQTFDKAVPAAVVFTRTTAEVATAVRICHEEKAPFLARGAGTGLSGGCIALDGAILIETARMREILDLDYVNQRATVQPGLVNARLTKATKGQGYYYAPDPSSQPACTIGGNVAENSGGPHTLKYGVTTNHTYGLEIVLPDGEVIETGGAVLDAPGYDLTGLYTGCEGTFGICTKVVSRILPVPEAVKTMMGVFRTIEDGSNTVSDIIAAGIIPAALEMMDQLFIQAVENFIHAGFPLDAGSVLIVELDGLAEGMDEQAAEILDLCRKNNAVDIREAKNEEERAKIWKARKSAFGAIGYLSKSYYTHDGVIPRTNLPEVLKRCCEIGEAHGLRVTNVFHAGDGNLHPVILYDSLDPDETRRALEAGDEILRTCAEYGGTLTGEHGIGTEKRDLMPLIFEPEDLETMRRVRKVWDPENLCNPNKVLPTPSHCSDKTARLEAAHQAAV